MIDLDLVKIFKRLKIFCHQGTEEQALRKWPKKVTCWWVGRPQKKGPKFSRAYDKFQRWIQIQLQTNFHVGFKE